MTDQEFEKLVADLRAKGVETERPVKEHDGWTIGTRVRVLEDDEDNGLYADTEGIVLPEEVGAVEYQNLHVKLFFLEDGMDAPIDVDPDNLELV